MKPTFFTFAFWFLFLSSAFGRFWLTPENPTQDASTYDDLVIDWLLQDLAFDPAQGQRSVERPAEGQTILDALIAQLTPPTVQKVLDEIQASAQNDETKKRLAELQNELKTLEGASAGDTQLFQLYKKAAEVRRGLRLASLKAHTSRIFFTKHHNLGGSHYAYTEALSDARAERHFWAGSQLCELQLNDAGVCTVRVLIDDPAGMIRDPDLTRDGKNVVFAWKRSDFLDDFHLWRMNLETGELKQLTFGLGWADYEPCVLPSGDIMFNSTRCVQAVDCFTTEVSNLYRMDSEGRFLRRVSFDQVHDNYPVLMNDGRVIYTRWDYNDRGQIFPQGLFQMNPDGTAQTALYGNNSWFPTTILHSRPIPNTNGKILCVFSGHHTRQRGKLGVLDPNQGREEADGATLAAPFRETEPVHVDGYGQSGEQFCYPMPVTETEFLVSYRPNANPQEWVHDRPKTMHDGAPFGIYFMNLDGRRELLAVDYKNDERSCTQPFFLREDSTPGTATIATERPSMVDPSQETGVYYLQDVFYGPGLEGVDRKDVRSLRVVEIGFRTVWIGSNGNSGPAGGAMSSTPPSIGGGAWDPKRILGEAKIYEDGSACFRVPAKTPVYFQIVNQDGHVIQTMRSWSTLQPGETFSCVGCHEDKNSIAARGSSSMAMKAGPQELQPFHGPARWFSFEKEIQPILDRNCVRCHENSERRPPMFMPSKRDDLKIDPEKLDLLLPQNCEWSFVTEKEKMADPRNLQSWVNEYPLPNSEKGRGGFQHAPGAKSSWTTPEIWLTTELNLPEGFETKPLFMSIFHDEDVQIYVNGTKIFEESGFNVRHEGRILRKNPFCAGRNVIAAHCVQTGGGQGLSFAIYSVKEPEKGAAPQPANLEFKPFSLKNTKFKDDEAGRFWSESYMNLVGAPFEQRASGRKTHVVNWIGIQESPQMLKPYNAGAFSSSLCTMFNEPDPHNGVKLTQAEKDLIAAWIDLLVPFCGDYTEFANWKENEQELNEYFTAKREITNARDAQNYAAWAKNAPEECVVENQNPYADQVPTAEKKQEGNVLTFTFDQPKMLDQVKIRLKSDAPSDQRFEVQLGGFHESNSIPPGNTGTFAVQKGQSTQEAVITGETDWIEKVEIFGFNEEKK